MTYNGWKNWETWNVALWADNEYGVYRDRMTQKPCTAQEVEAFIREHFPDGTPDMINRDIDPFDHDEVRVDWQEIAEHWAEDYKVEIMEVRHESDIEDDDPGSYHRY